MTLPYAEPVVRVRPKLVVDPYSGETTREDWSQAAESTLFAGVADSGSTEPLTAGRAPVDSDFTLFFDGSVDLTAQDRVKVRGLLCNVVGRPFLWRSPFTGWEPGTAAQAKIREG